MTTPAERSNILVVDDEASVRSALSRYLERAGYQVHTAPDGPDALDLLGSRRVEAMISDMMMPGMSGAQLLTAALARDADLAVIMLTALNEPEAAIHCLKLGAMDYLIKPVNLEELGLALETALRRRQLELDRRGLEQWLAREVAAKTKQLQDQSRQVELLAISVLTELIETLEPRVPEHRNHSARVSQLAGDVAEALGLSPEHVEEIRLAGRLHNVGRLALKDEGLRRVSKAVPTELVGATDAPAIAARILEPLKRYAGVVEIVRLQHERWDGKGHPRGLRGEAIPVGARIVAAAALYDELTGSAQEGHALQPAQAMESLRGMAGTLLDPTVLAALEKTVLGRGAPA